MLKPLPPILSLHSLVKSPPPAFFCVFFRYWEDGIQSLGIWMVYESSQCWTTSVLSACHQRRGALDFWSSSWSYSGLTPAASHPSYLGCLGAGCSTPGEVSPEQTRAGKSTSWLYLFWCRLGYGFWAASVQWWISWAFSERLLSLFSAQVGICAQECPVLGIGPYSLPCSSRVLHMNTSQAFQGPFLMAFLPSNVLSAPHNLVPVVNLLVVSSILRCWQMLHSTVPVLTSKGHHGSIGHLLSAWTSCYWLQLFVCSYPVNSLSIQWSIVKAIPFQFKN